ncbi:transmembrane protease serine 5 [Podarcis muralis]
MRLAEMAAVEQVFYIASLCSQDKSGVQSHNPGPSSEAKGEERSRASKGNVPSKTFLVNSCTVQRCLLFLGSFGLLIGTTIGVWFLVFFRINRSNFLLEVQAEGQSNWFLVCHENWDVSLGMQICRWLGHARLTHHKGVNLTDVKLNTTQEFAQILPNWKRNIKDKWQMRLSGWVAFAGLEDHTSVKEQVEAAVEKAVSHPNYSSRSPDYDIAMLKLKEPLRFSGEPCQQPATLGHLPITKDPDLQRELYTCTAKGGNWNSYTRARQGLQGMGQITPAEILCGLDRCSEMLEVVSVHIQCQKSLLRMPRRQKLCLRKSDFRHLGMLGTPVLHHQFNGYKIYPSFQDTVGAVCLPQYHQDIPSGSTCWISAQDTTRLENATGDPAETLTEVPVTLLSTQKCNSSCRMAGELSPRMLCAHYLDGNTEACKVIAGKCVALQLQWDRGHVGSEIPGDQDIYKYQRPSPCFLQAKWGGPLVCLLEHVWRLVGIGSQRTGCKEPEQPGVYTEVAEFLDWIHHVMEVSGGRGWESWSQFMQPSLQWNTWLR